MSSNTKIEEIVQRTFKVIGPYAGIVSVKEQLLENSFCVVLDQDCFLGILTPSDIVESPYQLVIDCMHNKHHVDHDQEIVSVLYTMIKNHTTVAPVFNKNEFIGVICREHIIDYLLEYPADLEQKIAGLGRARKAKRASEMLPASAKFSDAPVQELKDKKSNVGISVFLASRDRIYRTTIRNMLKKQPDIEIRGEGVDAKTIAGLIKDCTPDIIIFDCKMAALKYSGFTQKVSSVCPAIKIIVIARCSNKRCIEGMIRGGVHSCLLEDYYFQELVHAIHMVRKNVKYFPARVKEIIETIFEDGSGSNGSSILMLTNREREVLKLISEGNSTKEIAYNLCVSTKTVETHRLKIMNKLNIHSIAGLTKYAIREGLTDL